jgi:hypothetical protein
MCYGWYDEVWQIERAKHARRVTEDRKQQAGAPATAGTPEPEPGPDRQPETQPEAVPA